MRSLVLAGCVLTAVLSPARAADVEANKEFYRHYIEDTWNKRNPAALDRYLAPDFIEHNTNLPPGLEGRKKFMATVLTAFPDYHAEIQDVVAEGDRVSAWVVWTGTNDGPYDGRPPTHNKLRFTTADFFPHRRRKDRRALGRGQCAPTPDCAWPDPAAGGVGAEAGAECDGKAALEVTPYG